MDAAPGFTMAGPLAGWLAGELLTGLIGGPVEPARGLGLADTICPMAAPGLPGLGISVPVAPGLAGEAGRVVCNAAAEGDSLFGSGAGLSGTEGSRCARMSAARTLTLSATAGSRSSCWVTTSTSSSRLRLATGLTRMLRKRSAPGETFVTVPTGRPLGKIRSPPLVSTFSRAGPAHRDMTFSSTTSPAGVPRNTPCNRDFSRIAPTPLV